MHSQHHDNSNLRKHASSTMHHELCLSILHISHTLHLYTSASHVFSLRMYHCLITTAYYLLYIFCFLLKNYILRSLANCCLPMRVFCTNYQTKTVNLQDATY
eukprot:c27068_g1_i12 orf=146-451(-)